MSIQKYRRKTLLPITASMFANVELRKVPQEEINKLKDYLSSEELEKLKRKTSIILPLNGKEYNLDDHKVFVMGFITYFSSKTNKDGVNTYFFLVNDGTGDIPCTQYGSDDKTFVTKNLGKMDVVAVYGKIRPTSNGGIMLGVQAINKVPVEDYLDFILEILPKQREAPTSEEQS